MILPSQVEQRVANTTVALVADSLAEGWHSMHTYSAALARGFRSDIDEGSMRMVEVGRPCAGSQAVRYARVAWDRYLALPHLVKGLHAPVTHILDQSYAHLIPDVEGKVVVTCHDLTGLAVKSHSAGNWLYRRYITLLRDADTLVAISNATRALLVSELDIDPRQVAVLPHGIADRFFEAPWQESVAPLRVLHVGSNAAYKRMDLVVRSVLELARSGRATEFWKVGEKLHPEHARQLGVSRVAVRQFGFVQDEELPAIYQQASVLLFPSSHEGQGKPVVEAMAVGLPVVASAIPALHEVAGTSALLVEGDDPDSYAHAICRVIEDVVLRSRMSREGRVAADRFRWETHVQGLRTIYEGLIRT